MKYRILTFLLAISLFIVISCSEDDEDATQFYTVKITNTTSNAVTIFISANGGAFSSKGTIPSGQFREFSDMVLSVNYAVRASAEGNSADEYFSEQNISNSNPEVLSLNLDILE